MGPTREEVLKAERCNGFASWDDDDVLDSIFVVPDGPYEQPVYWYYIPARSWGTKSQDSFWTYYDCDSMMTQLRFFSNEEALQMLEELHAFDQEGNE